jgi:hypothetical protein
MDNPSFRCGWDMMTKYGNSQMYAQHPVSSIIQKTVQGLEKSKNIKCFSFFSTIFVKTFLAPINI